MKKFMWVALGVLLFMVPSYAQGTPEWDAAAGYSYLHTGGTGLHGVSGSVAYNFNNVLAGVGDLGVVHTDGTTVTSYTFGPRFNYRTGDVTPYFEALFGGSHFYSGVNPFTFAIEGGTDINLWRDGMIGLRPEMGYMGFHRNGSTLNGFRFGLSVVFHIGEK